MIPPGAQRIVAARKQRKKPADMVIVTTVGWTDDLNPQVLVDGLENYEWWWVRGLRICVFAKAGTPWKKTLEAIMPHQPAYAALWDVERLEGGEVYWHPTLASLEAGKSVSNWDYQLDYLPWTNYQNKDFQKCS